VVTSLPCNNCGAAASAAVVRSAEPFSTKLVAEVQLDVAGTRPDVARLADGAFRRPPDTSPPPGVSPLRI
jgi:hypothetical protein